MDPRISIEKGENFVHSRVTAPISWDVLAEQISRAAEKGEQWGFHRYLVDFRDSEKQLGVLEDHDVAYRRTRECGLGPIGTKHALIVKPEEFDEFRFVETAFRNAGYDLKVFTEEDAALEWIRE